MHGLFFRRNGWSLGLGSLIEVGVEQRRNRGFRRRERRLLVLEFKHGRKQRAQPIGTEAILSAAGELENPGRELMLQLRADDFAVPGFGDFGRPGQQHQVHEPRGDESARPHFPEGTHADGSHAERRIEDGNIAHALPFDHAEHGLELAHKLRSQDEVLVSGCALWRKSQSRFSSSTMKPSFGASQTGQVQCSGNWEKGVPDGICQ